MIMPALYGLGIILSIMLIYDGVENRNNTEVISGIFAFFFIILLVITLN